MSSLLSTLRRSSGGLQANDASIGMDEWLSYFNYGGLDYPYASLGGTLVGGREEIPNDFVGMAQSVYRSNGVVFSCMAVRAALFSEARFQFRRIRNGRPGDLYGTRDLALLEKPWTNGSTRDLLARMVQDVDLAGNFYATTVGTTPDGKKDIIGAGVNQRVRRMRPDWVTIVLGSKDDPAVTASDLNAEVIGYIYRPKGPAATSDPVPLMPWQVAHWAPTPDPIASYRGMSWLTPILREIMSDSASTTHKLKYFEQGCTANMVVSLDPAIKREAFEQWIEMFEENHTGYLNAYRTLYLGAGADAKVIGNDLKQIDFKAVQGAGEPLALDTPVPTPDGWTTMGEIQVGDQVFGRAGGPVDVVGAFDTHLDRRCYRLTFSDRTSIIADAGHTWRVIDRTAAGSGTSRRRPECDRTTEQLLEGIDAWRKRGRDGNRYGIPAGNPVELEDRDLLVDPYVLGAWLGDGQTAGAAICGVDPDLAFIQAEFDRRGYTTRRWATREGKAAVFGIPGGLLAALDALGVLGDKHIPDEYLRASKTQRLDLLRGLMDTDGTVGRVGKETCEYGSKLEGLARQVAELARSLGYRATVSWREDPRSRTGRGYRITFRADPDIVPFLLARKADRCQTPVWVKNRALVSIEPVESVPVRCIAVDSPDHLFRAGAGWTLTHNTRIAAAAGVPPVIAGFSEGLQAATYANYGQARRRFSDGTMRPLWGGAADALSTLVPVPEDSELAVDLRDVSFIQEDLQDDATIKQTQAATIKSLIDAGYKPDTVVAAIQAGDFSLLEHTGLYSVQLQPPGTTFTPNSIPASNGNGNGVPPVPAGK